MDPELPISPDDWANTPPAVRILVTTLWRQVQGALAGRPHGAGVAERGSGLPRSREERGEEVRPPRGSRREPPSVREREILPPAPGRNPGAASIEGETGAPPTPASEDHLLSDLPPVDEAAVESLYGRACVYVEEVMRAAREGRPFQVEEAFAVVTCIVGLDGAIDLFYQRAIIARESSEEDHEFSGAVLLHSVNVCIYALRIGEGMGLRGLRLVDLGVAALLHDIGMARLPDSLIEKKGIFSAEELKELRRHPEYGYEILSRLDEPRRWLARVALEEQEREDGSGYPRSLKGDAIHEFARIIAVADCFAGLTRSRPDRPGMMPFQAVRFIIQNQRSVLSQRVIRILVAKLTAFPLRTRVRLNSGAIAMVVATHESQPLRPTLRILLDSQGVPIQPPKEIDLREMPILHISDVVG